MIAIFAKAKLTNKRGINRAKVRFSLQDEVKEKKALVHSAERFAFLLKDFHSVIIERLEWIKRESDTLTRSQENKMEEIQSFLNELTELRNTVIYSFIKHTSDVKWIEIDIRSPQNVTTFIAQPASVADQLKAAIFSTQKSGSPYVCYFNRE